MWAHLLQSFLQFILFFTVVLGYIVAFTEVLVIYQICLNSLLLPLTRKNLILGQASILSIALCM
jgi:hypothetical protein